MCFFLLADLNSDSVIPLPLTICFANDVWNRTDHQKSIGRARLIQKIYEVDPLICSKCQGKMSIIRIKLKYTKNGGKTWNLIETLDIGQYSLRATEGYRTWTVPDVSETRRKCKAEVVLKDENGKTVGRDVSDGFFEIHPSSQ